MSLNNFARGSEWRCWDLHIHTPFSHTSEYEGDTEEEKWNNFFEHLELISEKIKVVGINDYLFLDGYKKVLEHKQKGNLKKIDLILPVVEFRLKEFVGSNDLKRINYHIIFADHSVISAAQIEAHFLNQLSGSYNLDANCTDTTSWGGVVQKSSLTDLGRAVYNSTPSERRGKNNFLEIGFNNINYELSTIEKALGEIEKPNSYLKGNYIKAIGKAEWESFRWDSCPAEKKSIINKSHFVFSASPTPEDALKGKNSLFKQGVNNRLLHCSDSHQIADDPTNTKPKELGHCFTWLKADTTFDGLKQVIMDSKSRIFIGKEMCLGSMPSYTIDSVEIKNAPWLQNSLVPLNSGLVTIIGARGSGKTALADLIAAGGYSATQKENKRSFIERAKNLLKDESITLKWLTGDTSGNELKNVSIEDFLGESKVQYLSQQFVDQLCAADGVTKELMKEIERVVFEAHKPSEQKGTQSFDELIDIELSGVIEAKKINEGLIKNYAERLNTFRSEKENLPNKRSLLTNKKKLIEDDKKNRQALVGNNQKNYIQEYEKVSTALDNVRKNLEIETRKKASITSLRETVVRIKNSDIPNHLADLKGKYDQTGLSNTQWDNFELKFKGDVEQILSSEITKSNKIIESLTGLVIKEAAPDKLTASLIPANAELSKQPYNLLKVELARLEKLIGINKENAIKLKKLSEKIAKEEILCSNLEKEISEIEKSNAKITDLLITRKSSYKQIFESLLEHKEILEKLYGPLQESLKEDAGSLKKMTFHVQRLVNIESWVKKGESLLDLRKGSTFRNGKLFEIAKEKLLPAWQTGSPDEVSNAMEKFSEDHNKHFSEHSPDAVKNDSKLFVEWRNKISEWIYSTSHILIEYGVQYDGIDIQQLSPGTRGIVLLLLYLAIDKEDYRPLIIDQPEENLDPKSIFDELVEKFRSAKLRRQIIIVTHNANLVVNTDADQVIVASCGSPEANKLPKITYESGSLENPNIRKKVCEILEGGEEAFKERAKRLRVKIN